MILFKADHIYRLGSSFLRWRGGKRLKLLTACRATAEVCNKQRVVKNQIKKKMACLSSACVLWGPSVNIKDTAGCSVLIKQVSVHKQLIDKGRPSPPPNVRAALFHFMSAQYYTPLP